MPGSTAVERGVGLVVEVTLAVAGLVVVVAGGRWDGRRRGRRRSLSGALSLPRRKKCNVKSGKPSANEIKIRTKAQCQTLNQGCYSD
uniref:Uncharacterized protein n=1 Tax=Oryza rufipogon TaxID=4529 RepID=A0A0E0NGT3_ORYRU